MKHNVTIIYYVQFVFGVSWWYVWIRSPKTKHEAAAEKPTPEYMNKEGKRTGQIKTGNITADLSVELNKALAPLPNFNLDFNSILLLQWRCSPYRASASSYEVP
jgi:hypothetical protein